MFSGFHVTNKTFYILSVFREENKMACQCSGSKKKLRTFVYIFNEKLENKYFFIRTDNKCECVCVCVCVCV